MKRKIMSGLAVIAFLAVTAAGSLFWFNWWLRFGTTRIYPLCFNGDRLVEFNDPLTPEASAIFLDSMMPHNEGYVWIEEGNVIAKNWYWLFGEAELMQRTNYFLEELAKSQGLDPEEYCFCRHIAQIGTPAHDSHYSGIIYPSNFTRDMLEPLSFGASSERAGHFTDVGRFYQWLGQVVGIDQQPLFECPSQVDGAPISSTQIWIDGITNGPPDKNEIRKGKFVQTWSFGANGTRDVTLICDYANDRQVKAIVSGPVRKCAKLFPDDPRGQTPADKFTCW